MKLKTYKELYEKYGEIKIKCEAKDNLPLDAIMDFQGGLKKRTKANKIKLATRMFQNGFIAPFFIWQHNDDYFSLDGHARSSVLCEIRKAGIPIPSMFPAAYIQAETKEEAKEILLSISSQYGDWVDTDLINWIDDIDEDITKNLRLMNQEIDINIDGLIFSPNINPGQKKKTISALDLKAKEDEMSTAFMDNNNLTEVICPKCNELFYIEKNENIS